MTEVPEFTTRPELAGTFGMVASTHWLASAAGMAVLDAHFPKATIGSLPTSRSKT